MRPVPRWRVWLTLALTIFWGIAMIEFARQGAVGFAVFAGLMFLVNVVLLRLITRKHPD